MGPGREGRGPRMPDACKLCRSLLDRGPLQKACERALKSDMLPCLPERFAKGEGSSCLCREQCSNISDKGILTQHEDGTYTGG